MVRLRKIDGSAANLLRHRFMQTLVAAFVAMYSILFVVGAVASLFGRCDGAACTTIVWSTSPRFKPEDLEALVGALLIALLYLVCSVTLRTLHRRIAGTLFLAASSLALAVCLFALAAVLALTFGTDGFGSGFSNLAQDIGESGLTYWEVAGILLLLTPLLIEVVVWSLWQTMTTRRDFLGVRGCRLNAFAPLSLYLQQLAIPSYVFAFRKGRTQLFFVHLIGGVLNFGILALGLLVIVLWLGNSDSPAKDQARLVVTIAFAAFLFLHVAGCYAYLARLGSRIATRVYQRARDWDRRPPILFLRSFSQDEIKLPAPSIDPIIRIPTGVAVSLSIDEILLAHTSAYGPVIAVGDPQNPVPPLGAARVFVEGAGNEWQDVVSSLLISSRAVILCPSESEGVQWEFNLVASLQDNHFVILLANPTSVRDQIIDLFSKLVPGDWKKNLERGQTPVAAFRAPGLGWQILTARKIRRMQSYTVAINDALQELFGSEVSIDRQKSGLVPCSDKTKSARQ